MSPDDLFDHDRQSVCDSHAGGDLSLSIDVPGTIAWRSITDDVLRDQPGVSAVVFVICSNRVSIVLPEQRENPWGWLSEGI